jgi:hypothetical protein
MAVGAAVARPIELVDASQVCTMGLGAPVCRPNEEVTGFARLRNDDDAGASPDVMGMEVFELPKMDPSSPAPNTTGFKPDGRDAEGWMFPPS